MTNQAIPEPAPYVLPAEIRRAVKFPTSDRLATLNVADCELLAAEFDRLTAENAALKAEVLAAGDELMVRWQESLAARSDRDRLAGQVQAMRDWADKMEAEAPRPAQGGFFADAYDAAVAAEDAAQDGVS